MRESQKDSAVGGMKMNVFMMDVGTMDQEMGKEERFVPVFISDNGKTTISMDSVGGIVKMDK